MNDQTVFHGEDNQMTFIDRHKLKKIYISQMPLLTRLNKHILAESTIYQNNTR